MEFSGQYLTYLEYKALGGTLTETPFNLLEFEARKQIDLRTQERLVGVENIPQEVKLCMFKLINILETYSESASSVSKNVASESTDGYSISYVTSAQIEELLKSKGTELDDIIMTYLFGVIINNQHIIYNGVI